jgi:transcription initiation factor TFIIIB Brf1 subunit/transcription initiation factor TFIIB
MKCVARVANKLGISEKTKYQAMKIMTEVLKKEMTAGKDQWISNIGSLCVMCKF